ncbi:3-dehydroquinate synthase [Staphylococcus intermedius]|uniref:3-dehydroquinate synthase n=1 Tax=Staphylococcus intermedius NCTC 11048 TaxID=1141106 RepID=A0A380G6H6_STAIN|nr:3-dehydroquinate synthase [Staphylococcus intermedius]PCF64889.1 3-dehydroquinate synthase [Staphylococcus intermedius]PCF80499.1 3-dehydroquinate synthase [Staphylococcus intermedius]PCF81849.1 3-dehydroquinate synthase [Staphylococcus intermedius]PCF88186.1 3-dehydroquinate synthase [Staphylococcus intermedius]PCF88900.1 3-dehydroquinate synthase [Staphylococcus intermedius]
MQLTTTYPDQNYPIIIEHAALDQLDTFVSDYQHVFVFIDQNVYSVWESKISRFVNRHDYTTFQIPSGEQVKYMPQYEQYIEALLAHRPTRNTCLIAIGGGATGDFVGFLAATLLRGVDFIQVPTTILAHDSSIGGKVGINTAHGKNLIGAFHRPKAVIYDLEFLTSLPYSEILSGYGEVYKHALLNDAHAVNTLENAYPNHAHLKTLQGLEQHLINGIQTKLQIVLNDEKERGQRQFLNLGHTFGHAIEYQYQLAHGHAVMMGILYQFIVSNLLLDTQFDIPHYMNYFKALGYPLEVIRQFEFEPLLQLMLNDKKNDAKGVRMVLLQDIGKPIVKHVETPILELALETLKQQYMEVN